MMALRRAAAFAIRGLLVLIAITLATGLSYRLHGLHRHGQAAERFRAEVGSLETKDYAPPDVPMLENGATWIRRGVGAVLVFKEEKDAVFACEEEGPTALDAAGRAGVTEVIARNRPALHLIADGGPLTRSEWGIDYAQGSRANLPDLLAAIDTGRLLACDGRLALERGDLAGAKRRFEELGAMARTYETEPVMIVQLIGTAIERSQLFLGRELLRHGDIDGASLSPIDVEEQMRRSFALEAATTHAVIRGELPLVDPHGTIYTLPASERGWEWFFGPNEGADYLTMWIEIDDATRKPWAEGVARARMAASSPGGGIAIPNMLDAFGRAQATRTLRDGLRAAIELRRVANLEGRYPGSIPDSLRELAVDRLTGRPLAYSVHADGSARLERPDRPTETPGILASTRFHAFYWDLPASGGRP
jgi:hypothetical protein